MDFDLDWLINCPLRNCELVVMDNNGTKMIESEVFRRQCAKR